MKKMISIIACTLASALYLTACGQSAATSSDGTSLTNGGVLILSVNPEIAVEYDEKGLVTGVTARNDDALTILNSCTGLIGQPTRNVVADLVSAIGENGYFVEEVEGEARQITLEIEPGSSLPSDTFLDDVITDIRSCVSSNDWATPLVVEGESDYGMSDYVDTDYGEGNDGFTDYDDTDYGTDNDGVTDYDHNLNDDTDYGEGNDGVTDYDGTDYADNTDYGINADGNTDYNDTDYGTDNDGVTDYDHNLNDDTDYGEGNDGVTDYDGTDYTGNTDYGINADGNTDYNDTDYGVWGDGITDYDQNDDDSTDYGDSAYDAPDQHTTAAIAPPANYNNSDNGDSAYDDDSDSSDDNDDSGSSNYDDDSDSSNDNDDSGNSNYDDDSDDSDDNDDSDDSDDDSGDSDYESES